jgi:hypothetical protein
VPLVIVEGGERVLTVPGSGFCPSGFLSPASRGALLSALLVMYLLLAVAAGYGSVYLWGLVTRSYEDWYKVRARGLGPRTPQTLHKKDWYGACHGAL